MALAPDWTEDEKKRRAGLTRYDLGQSQFIADDAGRAAALAQGANLPELRYNDPGTGRGSREQGVVPGGRSNGLGRRIERAILGTQPIPELENPRAEQGATPVEVPRGDPRNRFNNVFDGRSDLSETNLKGAGLQRVVKTADGVYTDNPNATGDVRYYNQFGNRADVGDVAYNSAGLSGPDAVAAHLAAENAAKLDVSDPANARLVLEHGREAQRQMTARQAQLAERQQMEFLASLDPAEKARLTTERIKEAGLDRRAAATIAATTRGQDVQLQGQRAGLINATGTQKQRDIDNQVKFSERLENPETRQAEIERVLAPLRGLSRTEIVRRIENDPAAQAVLAALEDDTRNTHGAVARLAGFAPTVRGAVGKLGGLKRNSTFADLSEDNVFPGIADKNAWIGGYVDPADINPALDEDLFRALMAYRQGQSAYNRSR